MIPDSTAEKPKQGEVIVVGTGCLFQDGTQRELQLKAGDRVPFGKYTRQTVKADGEEPLVMHEKDVMGVTETHAEAVAKAT